MTPVPGEAADEALALFERRWTLRIVAFLLDGPRRFSDITEAFPRIPRNVLAQRIRDLIEAGILQKLRLPPPAKLHVYALTDYGYALRSSIMALTDWLKSRPPRSSADGFTNVK